MPPSQLGQVMMGHRSLKGGELLANAIRQSQGKLVSIHGLTHVIDIQYASQLLGIKKIQAVHPCATPQQSKYILTHLQSPLAVQLLSQKAVLDLAHPDTAVRVSQCFDQFRFLIQKVDIQKEQEAKIAYEEVSAAIAEPEHLVEPDPQWGSLSLSQNQLLASAAIVLMIAIAIAYGVQDKLTEIFQQNFRP